MSPRRNSRVTSPRILALEVLRRVRAGEFADHALDDAARSLGDRDRAWLQELVYGTLRLRGRIDFLLEARVRGGIAKLDADVLDVLRLGAYQLLEMGSVPPYAAISQSQELSRAVGLARASGLVAGVLHTLNRERGEIEFPDPAGDPVDYLTTWGSHPRWLVARWVQRWGADGARALVEADNRRPELYIRPLGIELTRAAELLRAEGIGVDPVPFAPDSLRVLPPASAGDVLGIVPAVVQDPAASLVVRYADPPADSTVIDLCAAPGGKALGLTESARYVVAADVSPRRVELLRENAMRVSPGAGLGLVVADARQPPFRPCDFVLLDVPCTGTGTLRRHPDGRWRIGEADLRALELLQREMLDSAAGLVRPGGWLVYSTCSLEEEENEVQVDGFLTRHPEFVPDPPRMALDPGLLDSRGWLRVLPQDCGVDGSFAARLRRRG